MAEFTVTRKSLVQTEIAPVAAQRTATGTLCLDFGKAAFGTLRLSLGARAHPRTLTVHLGEKLTSDGRLDRNPPGTIRYLRIVQPVAPSQATVRLVIPSNPRNTGRGAIKMPPEIGEVFPFRYAEIEHAADIDPGAVWQVRVHYPFDETASAFTSSNPILNDVWELCKYSIQATSFCGVYVDGDRERIPYEADAYINQLSHYGVDQEYALARYTHEYLLQYPTWPTEWQMHTVLMAWADYMYTGETTSLAAFYDDLCLKTLIDLARPDGLISTASPRCSRAFEERLHLHHTRYIFDHGLRDLVDWPPGSFTEGGQGERDGHDMRPINTVVNAFHYRALVLMAQIAQVLGYPADQARFAQQAVRVKATFNRRLFDPARGVYVDGEGAQHASLHSNMFALAFDLVPASRRAGVLAFVQSRGMACSVYGAQYLLESLYRHGAAQYALDLLTAQHDRSWWHMLAQGGTITWEAWDWRYKNNLDWNHAWGAAPANIIPRFLLGVRPLTPSFRQALIQPQPANLAYVSGKVPTPHGPVEVAWEMAAEQTGTLHLTLPESMTAKVGLPRLGQLSHRLLLDGQPTPGQADELTVWVDDVGPGAHVMTYA